MFPPNSSEKKALPKETVKSTISTVCECDAGRQLFKEMVETLKEKKMLLVPCVDKEGNYGVEKRLLLLSQSYIDEIKEEYEGPNELALYLLLSDNNNLLVLSLPSETPKNHERMCALFDIKKKEST